MIQPTSEELRKTYAELSTGELIALKGEQSLLPGAEEILLQELGARGITSESLPPAETLEGKEESNKKVRDSAPWLVLVAALLFGSLPAFRSDSLGSALILGYFVVIGFLFNRGIVRWASFLGLARLLVMPITVGSSLVASSPPANYRWVIFLPLAVIAITCLTGILIFRSRPICTSPTDRSQSKVRWTRWLWLLVGFVLPSVVTLVLMLANLRGQVTMSIVAAAIIGMLVGAGSIWRFSKLNTPGRPNSARTIGLVAGVGTADHCGAMALALLMPTRQPNMLINSHLAAGILVLGYLPYVFLVYSIARTYIKGNAQPEHEPDA